MSDPRLLSWSSDLQWPLLNSAVPSALQESVLDHPTCGCTMLAQRQLRKLAFTFKRENDPPFPVHTFCGKEILPLKVKMSALCLPNA